MTDGVEKEREDLLERIWLGEAKALAAILESTPTTVITAAVLSAARAFLADQGTHLDSLNKNQRRGMYGGASSELADQIAEAVKADEQAPLPAPED